MVQSVRPASAFSLAGVVSVALAAQPRAADPCVAIAGQTWVSTSAVRACYQSFKVNATEKANILAVTTKMLPFHTSVNYEDLAPLPYTLDVHNDITHDLAVIGQTAYASDYDMHIALSRAFKKSQDGHFSYINYCYDSAFVNYLPTPLVVFGGQSVHIAPEAFTVATAEFGAGVQFWQDALPGALKGQLASLSGAQVLAINGQDPWAVADANAAISGGYQQFGTRQNGFFASYNRAASSWSYILGQFAQQSLPLSDSATLTIKRVNSTKVETVTIPYQARIGASTVKFTDGPSFRAGNCRAVDGTNGASYYDKASSAAPSDVVDTPAMRFAQMSRVSHRDAQKHAMNVILDSTPQSDVLLPPGLAPPVGLPGSSGVAQFYLLPDKVTGVLALGSFSATSFADLQNSTLNGLQTLVNQGAKRLIVDVTNNGGGFICIAHWLHRIIAGPKSTTVPQAGLDTEIRAGPLAQKIVHALVSNPELDPDQITLYNPLNYIFVNGTAFPANFDYLAKPVKKLVNLHPDAFSPRLGQECQPFAAPAPPAAALFDPKHVAIVSNGRCASSCSLFSTTMAKEEGAKMVVVGGRSSVPQAYCGTVGGQSTSYAVIDADIKTAGLKNDSLAPPDFITNSVQGITWRLGFGVWNKNEPEEWQARPVDYNLQLTADIVNKPIAIWQAVVKAVF